MIDSPSSPRAGSAAAAATDSDRFQVYDPLEILGILRALADRRSLVTVTYGEGAHFFVSTLLDVPADQGIVVLDCAQDEGVNERLVAAQRIACTALLDNIRIRFHVDGVNISEFDGKPALVAWAPATLLRLQRRETFRLLVPNGEKLACELRRAPGDPWSLRLPVRDISCGGLALTGWNDGDAPETHRIYRNCRLFLAADDVISADLEIVYLIDRSEPDGTRLRRCGARFVDLAGTNITRIQRYITKLERELHAIQENQERSDH